jgi:toxin FitB
MSRGILDTSILIAKDSEDLTALLPDEAAISVATLAELHYGVLVARDEVTRRHRLRRLGEVEATFVPLAIDGAVARAYATAAHAVKAAGGQPRARVMDLWIAATALAHGIPVYTRNQDDFAALTTLIEVRAV